MVRGGWYNGITRVGQTAAAGSPVEESPGSNGQGARVTPGRREPTESATENIPPSFARTGKGEMVR